MKITIQTYWPSELKFPIPSIVNVPPEDVIEGVGFITICEIFIDGQIKGAVWWDGKKLSIHKPTISHP